MANHYWPDGSAVGKQVAISSDKWLPIVGVVSDIRHLGLDQDPVDEMYGSLAESPQAAMSVVIRSSQTSPELGEQLRWIAHDIDPNAVVADVRPMMQVRQEWLASRRTTAMFLSIFAVVALCITASGISGMMALAVGERKHEIGVRLALGATPGTVILSMMKQVLVLMTVGLGTGFGVAWVMSTFDVAPHRRYRASRRSDLRSFVSAADRRDDSFVIRATDTNCQARSSRVAEGRVNSCRKRNRC